MSSLTVLPMLPLPLRDGGDDTEDSSAEEQWLGESVWSLLQGLSPASAESQLQKQHITCIPVVCAARACPRAPFDSEVF